MKLLRFKTTRGLATGVLTGEKVADLGPEFDDFVSALRSDPERIRSIVTRAPSQPLEQVQFAPPLGDGARVFCIGLNYNDHVSETGREMPPQPSVFIRTSQSIVGHGAAMLRPIASSHFDYEGELAVVIGRAGRDVTPADALELVAGYTCFNDGSIRDFQKHSVTAGKNFDSSGACGPWIVTADEISDPAALTVQTRLNGEVVQESSVDRMIYSIPVIVRYLSTITTLLPGDIIATGTPAGVGARRTPPLWMKPGDRIEVVIARVGTLTNPVAAAPGNRP